jgi:hypothetical protein
VGIAALAGGFGAGALAISKKNASNAPGNCNATTDVCTSLAGQQLRLDAIHAATASTTLVIVGGAALVTGIVLVATAPKKPATDPSVGVSLGPLGGSIRIRF